MLNGLCCSKSYVVPVSYLRSTQNNAKYSNKSIHYVRREGHGLVVGMTTCQDAIDGSNQGPGSFIGSQRPIYMHCRLLGVGESNTVYIGVHGFDCRPIFFFCGIPWGKGTGECLRLLSFPFFLVFFHHFLSRFFAVIRMNPHLNYLTQWFSYL